MPRRLFSLFPPLKYLVYTPTFHALHHSQVKTNLCLFMPLYDYVVRPPLWLCCVLFVDCSSFVHSHPPSHPPPQYGTADPQSETLHAAALAGTAAPRAVPDVVFLAHGTEVLSLLHLPFGCRGLAAHPFQPWPQQAWLYALWPAVLPLALGVAALGRVFCADAHALGPLRLETWVTPAFGLQFMLKSQRGRLNGHIGGAVAAADAAGVRVIGLGALNKAEALNGGGALFVAQQPGLRVRVVHGNTLTAAAVLRTIPPGTREVFLTGATSKLGRAIALYLSARGVLVHMYTCCAEVRGGARRRFSASPGCARPCFFPPPPHRLCSAPHPYPLTRPPFRPRAALRGGCARGGHPGPAGAAAALHAAVRRLRRALLGGWQAAGRGGAALRAPRRHVSPVCGPHHPLRAP